MGIVKKKFGNRQSFFNQTFSARVVALACAVPAGRVVTYGDIALAAGGGSMAAQSITSILGKAHASGVSPIPFHRIVYADGRVWLDEKYKTERLALYTAEKITLDQRGRVIDFAKKRFDFRSISSMFK